MAGFMRIHETKQKEMGLDIKNLPFSPASVILWETLGIPSLPVLQFPQLNVAGLLAQPGA